MFVKLLGLIDLFASLSLLMLKFNMFKTFALLVGFLVLVKSIIFFDGFVTSFDVFAFLMILLGYFGVFNIFSWIAFIWLLQKSVFSLI